MSDANIHALVGAYALGALEPAEELAFETHLDVCADCQAESASLLEAAASLGEAQSVAAPARLRASVMDAVAVTPQALPPHVPFDQESLPAEPDSTPGAMPAAPSATVSFLSRARASRLPLLAAAAAGVLILTTVGIGTASYLGDQAAEHEAEAQMMRITTATDAHSMDLDLGTSHLVMSEQMHGVVAMGQEAPMPASGMEYQLWMLTDSGEAKPGPTFMPKDDGSFMAIMTGDMDGITVIAITEEPMGGSAQPTGDTVSSVSL